MAVNGTRVAAQAMQAGAAQDNFVGAQDHGAKLLRAMIMLWDTSKWIIYGDLCGINGDQW